MSNGALVLMELIMITIASSALNDQYPIHGKERTRAFSVMGISSMVIIAASIALTLAGLFLWVFISLAIIGAIVIVGGSIAWFFVR